LDSIAQAKTLEFHLDMALPKIQNILQEGEEHDDSLLSCFEVVSRSSNPKASVGKTEKACTAVDPKLRESVGIALLQSLQEMEEIV
jgi:hypothetical protein